MNRVDQRLGTDLNRRFLVSTDPAFRLLNRSLSSRISRISRLVAKLSLGVFLATNRVLSECY